ncbi:MAG: VPLPA-CTERM sorting domain-containing protein [Gammaproteobacteria bacterium]
MIATTLLGSYSVAQAALVKTGTTVEYTIVNDGDLAAVGGSASIVGDQLQFFFNGFKATDTNGGPPQLKNLTLTIEVRSITSGNPLTNPSLYEEGDLLVLDTLPSINTFTRVFGQLSAANQQPPNGLETDNFSFQESDTNLNEDWSISESLENVAGWDTDFIVMTFQNNLIASAILIDDLAFIEKKFASITVTAVPVPAAVWLLGSALLGLGMIRRRKAA